MVNIQETRLDCSKIEVFYKGNFLLVMTLKAQVVQVITVLFDIRLDIQLLPGDLIYLFLRTD